MAKSNCWEAKRCGREPGGVHVTEFGVCPAAIEARADGLNGGTNGGRVCWALAGTLCGGVVQGSFATKLANCLQCDFHNRVADEEGRALLTSREILSRIH